MGCLDCGDTRHRWNDEKRGYEDCHCLREKQRWSRYRRAGVPKRYLGEDWKSFVESYSFRNLKAFLESAKSVRDGDHERAEWILVHGRPTRARQVAGALMLMSACDGGLDSRMVDVPRLIDDEFQPGRAEFLYQIPVLIVEVGGEPGNKWNRVVLEKVVHKRWEASLFTMLVVEGRPERTIDSYRSSKFTQAASERFVRVRVEPKEGE